MKNAQRSRKQQRSLTKYSHQVKKIISMYGFHSLGAALNSRGTFFFPGIFGCRVRLVRSVLCSNEE